MLKRVIVVDDEPSSSKFICEAVAHSGCEPVAFLSVSDCLNGLDDARREGNPLAMIVDVMMPEADGIELLRALAEIKFEIPIIITSARGEVYMKAARRLGTIWNLTIAATLSKPIEPARLEHVLANLEHDHGD